MLIGVDRVIVPIAEKDLGELSQQLEEAGLVYTGDTGLPDHPSADAHFALEGGGFIELVWERRSWGLALPAAVHGDATRRRTRVHIDRVRRRSEALRRRARRVALATRPR